LFKISGKIRDLQNDKLKLMHTCKIGMIALRTTTGLHLVIDNLVGHAWLGHLGRSSSAAAQFLAYRPKEVVEAYRKLELSPDEEVGPIEVKESFFRLAKRYHPDAGGAEADGAKFAAVRDAYKTVMESGTVEGVSTPSQPQSSSGVDVDILMKEFYQRHDFKHTAPQHRQYLSYDGFGRGSPMQRQRQFDKHRAETAAVKAIEYRVEKLAWKDEKAAVVVDKKKARDIKTRLGMDRVVEDLIQESMSKGEFDIIEGRGKPLQRKAAEVNPYSDFMTTKMNEILINNGYQPEWVDLGAEIRKEIEKSRGRLRVSRSQLGSYPFDDPDDAKEWEIQVDRFTKEWKIITDKMCKFNLLVPTLNQQMIPTTVTREVTRLLSDPAVPVRQTPRSKSRPIMNVHEHHPDAFKHFGQLSSQTGPSNSHITSDNMDFETPMELLKQMVRSIFGKNGR